MVSIMSCHYQAIFRETILGRANKGDLKVVYID